MAGISLGWQFPKSINDAIGQAKAMAFGVASTLTEPSLRVREYIVKMQIVDEVAPHPFVYGLLKDENLTRLAEKCYLAVGVLFFSFLSPLGILGMGIRFCVSNLEKEKFIHYRGNAKEKNLEDNTFTFLQWNICGIKGGYATGEGGQMPLSEPLLEKKETRLHKIVEKLLKLDADVISLNELFDVSDFTYIASKLKDRYPHMIGNCGVRSIGPNSGLALFSKFKVEGICFEPFPKEMLVEGAKYCEKGVLKASIADDKGPISDLFLTHPQHSEEPAMQEPFFYSRNAEIEARRESLSVIKEKVKTSSAETVILAGDLNMDDEEFKVADHEFYNSFVKIEEYSLGDGKKAYTWLGDDWYTSYTNRWSFLFGENKTPRKPSPPVNLDHVMVKSKVVEIETCIEATGYDPKKPPLRDSLSDHMILMSTISLGNREVD